MNIPKIVTNIQKSVDLLQLNLLSERTSSSAHSAIRSSTQHVNTNNKTYSHCKIKKTFVHNDTNISTSTHNKT